MDHVFSLDAHPPSVPPPRDPNSQPLPQQQLDGIRDLYYEYASGLDRFFETDWYTHYGLPILLGDQDLLHYFSHCLSQFHSPPSDTNNPKALPSTEARLIWQLASLAFSPSISAQPPPPFIPRIEAVSHLILGTFMPPVHVPPAPAAVPDMKTMPDQYAFYLQDLFWHHLCSFTTIHDDVVSSSSAADVATQLAGMRNILNMLENRDVLYSMAIARHFGGRMEQYHPDKALVGRGGEAEDPINKLVVAMGFLANEEQAGTTQVVQRVCGMSRRGFFLQRPENDTKHEVKHAAQLNNGNAYGDRDAGADAVRHHNHDQHQQHHQQQQDQVQHDGHVYEQPKNDHAQAGHPPNEPLQHAHQTHEQQSYGQAPTPSLEIRTEATNPTPQV